MSENLYVELSDRSKQIFKSVFYCSVFRIGQK